MQNFFFLNMRVDVFFFLVWTKKNLGKEDHQKFHLGGEQKEDLGLEIPPFLHTKGEGFVWYHCSSPENEHFCQFKPSNRDDPHFYTWWIFFLICFALNPKVGRK